MSLIRNIFLIIVLASLTSCGFGLRKPLALNYKSFDIIGGGLLDQSIARELSYD
jgi:outer membrane lipopolysaccharide assembly protein LptE/RlpB